MNYDCEDPVEVRVVDELPWYFPIDEVETDLSTLGDDSEDPGARVDGFETELEERTDDELAGIRDEVEAPHVPQVASTGLEQRGATAGRETVRFLRRLDPLRAVAGRRP